MISLAGVGEPGRRDRHRCAGIVGGRIVVGLPSDRRRRRQRGRRWCRAFRFGIGIGGYLGWSRLAGTLAGRQLQQTAAVEQRHRRLEGAEHDHDHARTNQQRANLGSDRRRFLVAGSRGRRLRLKACGLGGFAGLAGLPVGCCAAAAAWAARRAAAMKLDAVAGSGLAAGISLMALSEAAMRSEGDAGRPFGRVPGSSG